MQLRTRVTVLDTCVPASELTDPQTTSGLLDIGASCSMFASKSFFGTDYTPLKPGSVRIRVAESGRYIQAAGIGTASPLILNSVYGKHIIADIPNSLHVPDLERPLINFPDMHDTGAITLRPDHYSVHLPEHTIVLHRQLGETTLPIRIRPAAARHPRKPARTNHPVSTSQNSPFTAHNPHPGLPSALDTPLTSMSAAHDQGALRILAAARAGQPGASQHKALIRATATNGYIPKAIPTTRATADLLGKLLKSSFPTRTHIIHAHGLIIGIDTSGPHLAAHDPLSGGRLVRFFLVVIDEGSGYKWSYCMAKKSEAAGLLRRHFLRHGVPKAIRSDNALELTKSDMDRLRAEFAIDQWTTCVYTSQQNGHAERAIRSILEKASTIAAHSNIDPEFGWPLLVFMATIILNLLPQVAKPGSPTPYELRFARPWNYALDRIPGARAFVHMRNTHKFSLHAMAGIYLGRAEPLFLKPGYVVLLPASGTIVVSASVYVQENAFPIYNASTYRTSQSEDLIPINIATTPASRVDALAPPAPPNTVPISYPSEEALEDESENQPSLSATPTHRPPPPLTPRTLIRNTAATNPMQPTPRTLIRNATHLTPEQQSHAIPRGTPITTKGPIDFPPESELLVPAPDDGPISSIATPSEPNPSAPGSGPSSPKANTPPEQNPSAPGSGPSSPIPATPEPPAHLLATTQYALASELCTNPTVRPRPGEVSAPNPDPPVAPRTVAEALASPQREEWLGAMRREIRSLRELAVIHEVQRREPDEIILNSVWVFKIKSNGVYRARLAACGNRTGRMPVAEVFSPTVQTQTIFTVLAAASIFRAKLKSFDVSTAFMLGSMDGRSNKYVLRLPRGYEKMKAETTYLRLLGSMNGLREASQIFDNLFRDILTKIGFAATAADPSLFVKFFLDKGFCLVPLHVDDGACAYTCSDAHFKQFCDELTAALDGRIKWSDADDYLAMDISQSSDRSKVTVSMETYIRTALADVDADDSMRVFDTPAPVDILRKMNSDTSQPLDADGRKYYMKLVGTAGYIRKVRCDIDYAITLVASRLQAPTELDMENVKRIFGYLKSCPTLGRTYNGDPTIRGFSDADFGNTADGRSYSGVLVMMGGSAVAARTRRQTTVTTATADSELLALASLVRSIEETLMLLSNIQVKVTLPIELYCDNSATVLAGTTYTSRKSRHLANHAAYVREHTMIDGDVRVNLIGTAENPADFFTKALPRDPYLRFRSMIMEGKSFEPTPIGPKLTPK
jgi:transposase InsO family protein